MKEKELRKIAVILVLICFIATGRLNSQTPRAKNRPTHDDRPLYFGFNIGFNAMDFGIDYNTITSSTDSIKLYPDLYRLRPGFHVSIVSNLRLAEYFDLRFLPGISFGERQLYFIDKFQKEAEVPVQNLNSSFIELPLLIKYKGERINNFRPYVITGANMRIDLAAKRKYEEDKDNYLRLKPIDFYYEVGFGFGSYLPYFKFTTEIRYCIGLKNVLVKDYQVSRPEYVKSMDALHSRILMISFYFE